MTDFAIPPDKKPRKRPTRLREKEREMRAELILARKVQGRSLQQILDEFNIAPATHYRALAFARKNNFYERARDALLALVPKSIEVVDRALDADDVDSAWKVLEAHGLAGKTVTIHAAAGEPGTETFTELRTRILTRPAAQPSISAERLEGGRSEDGGGEVPGLDAETAPGLDPLDFDLALAEDELHTS